MKKFLLLTFAGMLSVSAFAQETTKFITTIDSLNVYNIMVENAPQNPSIKDVPRFTLVGKDSKFYLGMGANVKMVGDFDWGSPITNPNIFAPKDIPMKPEEGNRGQTLFSVGQSNIYWNFVALPGSKNQVGLFFDVIFLGNSSTPVIQIHYLYMKYRGFTAGYVVSTFTDLKAEPYSIDFGGPNAMTLVRHPNIYYTQKFGKRKEWTAQLGLDMPDMASFESYYQTKKVNQRMPDIPLFLQRSWCQDKGWLRFSAIFRDLQYMRSNGKNEGVFGWGVKLSGKTPIVGGLSACWEAVYGKGISSYIQDMSGEGEDLLPVYNEKMDKQEAVKVWGAYGSLQYNFGKCAFWNITYSQVRAYGKNWKVPAGSDPNPDFNHIGSLYKYGQYITSNLIFNVSSFAQLGVEYLWGRRMNYSGEQAHDNRLMLMLNVSI
ncbi:MAG: hypothetical protein J1F67_03310 [Muribaculaceae bacterium]|nr:hypothetical protein [Muribaculaceae bacterium]